MKRQILFILLLITTLGFAQQKGTVTGTITDKDMNNETLPFASVSIKGKSIGENTDENGKYSLEVPAGSHVLVIAFMGYETVEVPFTIAAGETKTINRSLTSGSVTMEEVVIQATVNREKETALLAEQKNAVEIKQSIGAQEMQRKGVSTVEQGVTKISGVSKVADRGIFIRGLDDRYNYLQINGLNFVPADPNLKTIPLSFIPTDVVRNIDIYKTFNSSLYQDFAGASINIVTKDIPSRPYTKISLSAGYNTQTTLKDFKSSENNGSNFFGYTGNSRSLPSVFGEDKATTYQATPQESKNLFDTSWSPETSKAPLNTGTNILHSDSFDLSNDRRIGYIFNVSFANSSLAQTGQRRNLNSEGTAIKDFQLESWKYFTQKTGLASINYRKTDKYNLFFNLIYLQNSENTTEEIQGENNDLIPSTNGSPFFLRDIKYTENTSFGFQHYGTLYFKEKTNVFTYGLAGTKGKNNMPDRKILVTDGVGENANYITFNGIDPFRFYSILDNYNFNGRAEYEIKFGGEDVEAKPKNSIKIGYNTDYTNYDFFNRTIRVTGGGNLTNTTINTNDPDPFFQQNFDNGYLYYYNTPDPTYKVEISQFINAGYVNYIHNWEKLTVEGGIRVEYLMRETKYREEGDFATDPYRTKKYNPFDINPVINAKYTLTDFANMRFTASRTSTKPRFREILPFRYQDGDGNFTFGNPDIKNTTNYNFDLKYEYFPTSSSFISLAGFGKIIKDPITRVLTSTSTGFLTEYANFDRATLFGLELESGVQLDYIFGESVIAKKTSFGLNAIYMKSKEEADTAEFPQLTSSSRSLQGASDFILNVDLNYEIANSERFYSKAGFIFNTFSTRIYSVGVTPAADIEQEPIHTLDFIWRNTFSGKYELNLTMKNLLNQEILSTQNPTQTVAFPERFSNVNTRLTQGLNIGLEFSYTF